MEKQKRHKLRRRGAKAARTSISAILRHAYRIYFWNKATRDALRNALR